MQLSVCFSFHAQNRQGFAGRAAHYLARQVETRTVAGTGKTVRLRFHRAAQVRADQAEGDKTRSTAYQQCRHLREQRARTRRIVRRRPQYELGRCRRLGLEAEETQQATQSEQPAVILWPEAPSHFMSSDPAFRAAVGQLAVTAKSPVIAGSLGVDRSNIPQRGYYLYDSASLFSSAGEYSGRYDKIHLVPWGEYIPFKQFFSFADKLTEGVGDMDRGSIRNVFSTGGHKYGVFVCYESIFGDEVRQFTLNNAEVLVNISDDGWYGDTGAPWQHLNMARMRAIENRRWLLRSTNTGITTAIDPLGRIAIEAPRHVRGAYAFSFEFAPTTWKSTYTRYGDWFAWLCTVIAVATLALCRFVPARLFALE